MRGFFGGGFGVSHDFGNQVHAERARVGETKRTQHPHIARRRGRQFRNMHDERVRHRLPLGILLGFNVEAFG